MQPALVEDQAGLNGEPQPFQASLQEAFGAFSSAAETLERSYFSLGQEVCRLRGELEQERDLRRRREALAEISALLAHEIRNPLASMELFAGLLAGSTLGDRERDWVEQIRSGLRILSATVNNILEFHSQRALDLAALELNGVLRSIKSLLAPVAERVGMRWVAELAPQALWIEGDQQRLEQVFLNLGLNAFRFAAQGGVLQVRSGRDAERAWVVFADKGPGIAADVLNKIFEARVSTHPGGAGLGLAVAKRVVEQHGGKIAVSSPLGEGTSFELHFPLASPVGIGDVQ